MMYTVTKNDPAYKQLSAFAETKNKPLREVLLSDDYLEEVSKIFYKNMPKLVRFTMKEAKFKDFYKNHREQLIAYIE